MMSIQGLRTNMNTPAGSSGFFLQADPGNAEHLSLARD